MFNVEEFYSDPPGKLSTIVYAKKSELLALAAKFEIAVNSRDRKDEIKNVILDHLSDENIVEQQEVNKFMSVEKRQADIEYMRLAIELEKEKREAGKEMLMLDLEAERKKLNLAMEKKEQELALEKAKLEHEVNCAKQLETEKSRLSVEEKQKILDLEARQPVKFDLAKNLKLVPDFNEKEVDVFFRNFEDIASSMLWPLDQWIWLVKPKLTGRAATVVSHLVGERSYGAIKQAVLDAYMITIEGHRQRFRQYYKSIQQTWYEFASEKLRLFHKWLTAAKVSNFDNLVNLLVTEEFMRKLPQNIKVNIADRQEEDLKKLAMLADNFSLIHKTHKDPERIVKQGKATSDSGEKGNAQYCTYCKKPGHDINECRNPTCKKSKFYSKTSDFGKYKDEKSYGKSNSNLHCYAPDNAHLYKDYICDGIVTVPSSNLPLKVKILRDTGSTQSMILHKIVPNVTLLDENVLVKDLSNTSLLPLSNIHLDCEYVTGNVKIAVIDRDFPLHDVHVLLGNDLACKNPFPNLIVYDMPQSDVENEKSLGQTESLQEYENKIDESRYLVSETSTQANDREPEEIWNVAVVTRAKAKLINENESTSGKSTDLAKLQREDPTLVNAYKQASLSSKGNKVPGYYFDNGILFRLYRPRKLSSSDTWANKEQLVVPTPLRQQILSTAHQANSHLGVTKTYNRITYDFFWPNLKRDVVEFVKQCHICQISGKPNEVIPKAPLIPIVVPQEPFSKIILDCVGPLPKSKKGNKYILTIMCPTTRFPIAIPISNISAKLVVKQLLKVFSIYGFPKEIQSDRGTNFTSDLFNQTLKEFNVKHSLASPYHPESQGALERHHQTLKSLLRKFCVETGHDWDESLDLLLFVIREVPSESLGMSPFEMMFGHRVRGPLQILKDKLMNDESVDLIPVVKYVEKLKMNLTKIKEFAQNNLTSSQEIMKATFDKKSKVRKFKVGDSVLAYFPTSVSPLKHKFSGPYVITKCMNNNNYVISTPDRRKSTQLVHVNLIKKYYGNIPVALHCLSDSVRKSNVVHQKPIPFSHDVDLYPSNEEITWSNFSNMEIFKELSVYFQHLPSNQSSCLQTLLLDYKDICQDVPQLCKVASHDINLVPGTQPIRQPYYRVSLEKHEKMKEEVAYLLENRLAIPSSSPWASPCLLVPKPNGKVRLCTDYRKLNNATIKDSYPLPRVEDILDAIGNGKYFTQIDMLSGYYQIPLTEKAKTVSAFITPFGLFQYERLPFGLCNAPATFQRVVNSAIQDLDGTYAYIDDIVVVSDTWEEHLIRLRSLFGRLRQVGLTLNLAKSSFCNDKVRYL